MSGGLGVTMEPRVRSTPVDGRGELAVVRAHDGRSVVSRAYATSPLRLLMPRNHGSAAWIYVSTYGGGLVEGDHVCVDMNVGPDCACFVSTQASTKIYRSTGTSAAMRARIGSNALLVIVPDPVVCFAASRYRQVQQFELAEDASLVLVDWLSSGRHATGERWVFDEYRARLTVRQCGTLVVYDSLALRAEDGALPARLGRFDVLGALLVLGTPLNEFASEIVRHVSQMSVERRPDHLAGVAAVGNGGCLLRFAGTSVERAARMLRAHLAFVPQLLGDDPWARKW